MEYDFLNCRIAELCGSADRSIDKSYKASVIQVQIGECTVSGLVNIGCTQTLIWKVLFVTKTLQYDHTIKVPCVHRDVHSYLTTWIQLKAAKC